MPIENWWNIHERMDYSYLLKQRREINRFEKIILIRSWNVTYNEYIKAFGFSDLFKQLMQKQQELARLKIEKMITGDRSLQTFIDITQIEIDDLNKRTQNPGTLHESKINIEKIVGFRIDTKNVSVREYYSYINTLKKSPKNGERTVKA